MAEFGGHVSQCDGLGWVGKVSIGRVCVKIVFLRKFGFVALHEIQDSRPLQAQLTSFICIDATIVAYCNCRDRDSDRDKDRDKDRAWVPNHYRVWHAEKAAVSLGFPMSL